MNGERPATLFSNAEEAALSQRTALDEIDRRILAITIMHPLWSNTEIGEAVGLNRIQVWRRKTKGPLFTVLLEFQKEAISSAAELVINEAHGAVRRLGQLSRGECDCSRLIKEQSENHREVCMSPVPYAVQRQAAKDLVEILANRKPEETGQEEEVWTSVVTEVGSIKLQKGAIGPVIDVIPEEPVDEIENMDSEPSL